MRTGQLLMLIYIVLTAYAGNRCCLQELRTRWSHVASCGIIECMPQVSSAMLGGGMMTTLA
jgi:hypothetical protein